MGCVHMDEERPLTLTGNNTILRLSCPTHARAELKHQAVLMGRSNKSFTSTDPEASVIDYRRTKKR